MMLPYPLPEREQGIGRGDLEAWMSGGLGSAVAKGDVDLLAGGGDIKPATGVRLPMDGQRWV